MQLPFYRLEPWCSGAAKLLSLSLISEWQNYVFPSAQLLSVSERPSYPNTYCLVKKTSAVQATQRVVLSRLPPPPQPAPVFLPVHIPKRGWLCHPWIDSQPFVFNAAALLALHLPLTVQYSNNQSCAILRD